jgi:hypothetical protein
MEPDGLNVNKYNGDNGAMIFPNDDLGILSYEHEKNTLKSAIIISFIRPSFMLREPLWAKQTAI